VVSFTPLPLYTRGKSPSTHWTGDWLDPSAGLDDEEKWKFLTLPGLEIRSLGRPARRQSLYLLTPTFNSVTNLVKHEFPDSWYIPIGQPINCTQTVFRLDSFGCACYPMGNTDWMHAALWGTPIGIKRPTVNLQNRKFIGTSDILESETATFQEPAAWE
jgi:hypothetical protein